MTHLLRLSRQPDGVFVSSNGREIFFSTEMWEEFSRMISDFNRICTSAHGPGPQSLANYTPLPTRTPLHANTPSKPTLEDLI